MFKVPSPPFSSSLLPEGILRLSQRDPSVCRLIPGDTHPIPIALAFTDLMRFLRAVSLSYLFLALQAMRPAAKIPGRTEGPHSYRQESQRWWNSFPSFFLGVSLKH